MLLARLVAITLLLAGCDVVGNARSATPPVQDLAQVPHVSVGDIQLRLPLVAISWAGRSSVIEACKTASSTPQFCAVPFDALAAGATSNEGSVAALRVDVSLEHYSSYKDTKVDRWVAIPELCAMLTKRWAQQQCNGASMFPDNLRSFSLVEEGYLDALGSRASVSAATLASGIRLDRTPSTICGPNGDGLCVVALRLGRRAIAVWIVARSDSGAASIERQARAIRAFVEHAAGEVDNLEELRAALRQNAT